MVSLLLGACAAKESRLAFNRYALQAPYGGDIAYAQAVSTLESQAAAQCKNGYRKLHDFDTTASGRTVLVWEIACKGVDRAAQGASTTQQDSVGF